MNRRMMFLMIGIGLHCVAAGVLVLMLVKLTNMTAICVIPAALIGCASVPAVRGRPVNLYVGFGLLMGLSFWMLLSAVNERAFLALFPMLLLAAGAVWLLQQPSWPSLIFTGVAIVLSLGLAMMMYHQDPDFLDSLPDRARKSALTSFGVLFLAASYSGLGFAENYFRELDRSARSRRRKRRRPRRDLPLDDEDV